MSSFRYNFNHVSSSSRNSGLLSSQKSVYDGVFGGAPRSGLANALAPRLEDYAEIFGSRSCSIPLLEVPVIDGCDSRLLHFDYSEVFGEYGNNFVAMSSFQELLDGGDCGYDADYHPWSPEQCGSISDEFDRLARAEKSPGSSDGDSLHSSELFNESDNKHTPIRTSRVSNSEASVHGSKHETRDDDIICNEVADDRITGTEQDSKFSPVRLSRIASSKSHRSDDYELAQDTPFITVSDISLRTKPSGLPPPSRAPPALTVKRSRPEMSNIKKRRAESDAGREVNASDSSQEMESMNNNIETMSKSAKETLGKDGIWSSITWDIEDVMKAEEGEDSVTSPCDEEREGSSVSVEKHSDLQEVHCSTHTGDSFVGIVSWSVETDYYDIFECNNAAREAFETIEDFNYLTQHRSPDDHRYQRTVDSMTLNEKQNPSLGMESPKQNVGTNQIERISNELQWSQEKQLLNNEKLKNVGPVRDFRKKIPELILPPSECEDNVIDHGGILRREVNDDKNELKETFDLKRYGMVIEEAEEHEETDEGSFEAVPCEKDILCQLPREGKKCEERLEGAIDHGFHGLRYDGNSKEQKFSEVNESDDALKRGNGYFSPGKELHRNKEVLEANLRLNVDTYELEGMTNWDAERELIDKNDDVREVSDDAFIDLASPVINGIFLNPLEASQGAVRWKGNQTSKVVPSTHTYKSQHVIDNPLFNVKLNRPTRTEDEDGTAHRVSKKVVTTNDDSEQEMKTSVSVISVNASKEFVDVRKMECEPSMSEQNDFARHSKIATRGINAKINTDQERESNLEHDYLRKLEEEKEREREREKDRMDVYTVVLEAREKLYTEKSSNEARYKAMADARERLEKDSAEVRLRAERAAVERATAEARQRATEKLISEKTSYNTRDQLQQSVSGKFATSAKYHDMKQSSLPSDLRGTVFLNGSRPNTYSSSSHVGNEGESPQRCKARLERYRRTAERAANALAEKNKRDLLAQREKEERNRVAEVLDPEVRRWANGKEGNLRALLSTLQYILGPDSGWQPVPLTKIITSAAVKTSYRKATLCVHPDKLQQRGATVQQKYVCEKVFDLLKEAWNKFSSEERC